MNFLERRDGERPTYALKGPREAFAKHPGFEAVRICGAVSEHNALCMREPEHRGRCWDPKVRTPYRARPVGPGQWVLE